MPSGRFSALRQQGHSRKQNEDHFVISELIREVSVQESSYSQPHERPEHRQGWLIAVADGLPGEGGDQAARLALQTLVDAAMASMPWADLSAGKHSPRLASSLRDAVDACQKAVETQDETPPSRAATTLTAAYIAWPDIYIVHVGDSRCLLVRDGTAHRMTQDHSYGAAFRELTSIQSVHPRFDHALTNAIGGSDSRVVAELRHEKLQPDDQVLLLTDGISDVLSDEEAGAILARGSATPPERGLGDLFHEASKRGATDNLCAVLGVFR